MDVKTASVSGAEQGRERGGYEVRDGVGAGLPGPPLQAVGKTLDLILSGSRSHREVLSWSKT